MRCRSSHSPLKTTSLNYSAPILLFFLQNSFDVFTNVGMKKNRRPPHMVECDALRKEFGLAGLESRPNGPAVDEKLIATFLNDPSQEPTAIKLVMDRLAKYAPWREAYVGMLIQRFKQNHSDDFPPVEPE